MNFVPDHSIISEPQYQTLANAVKPAGLLIESGDTRLNYEVLKNHFDLLVRTDDAKVWQRKAE